MDLTAAQPYYVLGMLPAEAVPSIAYNNLVRGRDGPSLLELASLSRPTWRDIGNLMDRALEEIGVPRQSTDEAWRSIAGHILDQVEAGVISLKEGGYQLGALASAADYPEALLPLHGIDDYLDLGLLTDEQWETALAQEMTELRARLRGGQAVSYDHRYGSGALYWIRRYGTTPEPLT